MPQARRPGQAALVLVVACVALVLLAVSEQGPIDIGETVHEASAANWIPGEATDPYHNIVNFKAYCVGVHPDAKIFRHSNKGGEHNLSSVLRVILRFGEKKTSKNIVLEYVRLVAHEKVLHPRGVSAFFLKALDKSILHGKGVLLFSTPTSRAHSALDNKYGELVLVSSRALQFESTPRFLESLAIENSEFMSARASIAKLADNADTHAAAAYAKHGNGEKYKSFLEREREIVSERKRSGWSKMIAAATKSELAAFKAAYKRDHRAKFNHVVVQTPAGLDASLAIAKKLGWFSTHFFPSEQELEAVAKRKADKYLAAVRRKLHRGGLGTLVSGLEGVAQGITLTVTSGEFNRADSSMRPKVTFVGSLGSASGRLDAVPQAGKSLSQTFPFLGAKVGKIRKVKMEYKGYKAWFCTAVMVRNCDTCDTIAMKFPTFQADHGTYHYKKKGFWLGRGQVANMIGSGAQTVLEMVPDKTKAPVRASSAVDTIKKPKKRKAAMAASCVGWRQVDSCNPKKGTRVPSMDRTCDAQIAGYVAGFCQCNSKRINVGCNGKSFTCKQLCDQLVIP